MKADDFTQFHMLYFEQIQALGYYMASGLNVHDRLGTIDVWISPMEGSPDPIEPDLFSKIKNTILPRSYKGKNRQYSVNVEYESHPFKPLSL